MKLKQIMLWLEDVSPVNLNNEIWKKGQIFTTQSIV